MLFRLSHRVFTHLAAFWLILNLTTLASAAGSPEQLRSDPESSEEPQSSPPFTIKVPVNTVLVHVTVTDKAGKPVKDLTVDDFELYENGKRQEIQSFELETGRVAAGPEPGDPASDEAGGQPTRVRFPEDANGEKTRLISCVIDDLTEYSPRYFGFVISALRKFVAEEMEPQDQLGIFSASGGVRVPFTSDQRLLRDQIENLVKGRLDVSRPYREMSDIRANRIVEGGYFGPERLRALLRGPATRQFNEVQSAIRNVLDSLYQHIRYVQQFRASKSPILVLISEGFIPGRQMRRMMHQVVDRATQSRVTLNVVDSKGLTFAGLSTERVAREQTLKTMAESTGGIYFRGSNDLVAGLRHISNTQSFYYVLSYALTNQKAEGKYHKIKVKVERPGLRVSHRRGYFEPRHQWSLEDLKNEDFRLALEAPGEFDQIPLQLTCRSTRLDENHYRLSVLTHVGVGGVQFVRQRGRHQNLLHLVVMVYDKNDRHVEGSEQQVELNLSESSYLKMLRHGFTSKTEMELPAGPYRIKVIVREGNQTRMGSLEETVTLPIQERPVHPADSIDMEEVTEEDKLSFPESRAKASSAQEGIEEKDLTASLAPEGLESSNLVLSQQFTALADLSPDLQKSLLEDRDSLIFKDVLIHLPENDQIDSHYPVTICYRLYNLNHPEESDGMTAQLQLTDESGRVSQFPIVHLREGNFQSRRPGTVDVAFNHSFKNVQPGRHKLTLMTRAPAASEQSVSSQATIMIALPYQSVTHRE